MPWLLVLKTFIFSQTRSRRRGRQCHNVVHKCLNGSLVGSMNVGQYHLSHPHQVHEQFHLFVSFKKEELDNI